MKPLNAYNHLEIYLQSLRVSSHHSKDEGARIIEHFNEDKFNNWKFKLEIGLVLVDLWYIVDESKGDLLAIVDSPLKTYY